MIISSLMSALCCAFMELLMYPLLLIKNADAAAAYLGLLPWLILILLTGTFLAVRRNGSMEIWIPANGILAIGAAASSLNGISSGIPLKLLLPGSFVTALIFCWMCGFSSGFLRKKHSWIVPFAASAGLLVVMCLFGKDPNGTGTITGLNILGYQIMGTEFVKIFAALLYASLFSKDADLYTDGQKVLLSTAYFITCTGCLLYMNELGTVLILLILHVSCIFLFIEKGRMKALYLLFIAAGTAAMVVFLIWVYPKLSFSADQLTKLYNRFIGCFRPDQLDPYNEGYSVMQSIRSILLGGLFGTSSLRVFLPEASNDFVFAYIVNNFGGIFGLIVFVLYAFIGIFGLKRSLKMHGQQQVLYCSFIILFTMQSFYNIAMNCSFLPVCGITCCLLSRGGVSLIISMMMIVYMVISKPERGAMR